MANRFRLYPSAEQETVLERHCAHARQIWNVALEQWKCWRPGRGSCPGPAERMHQLAEARQAFGWLAEGSSSVQQQALRDFAQAVANFRAGSHGRPCWRKRGRSEGFCVRDVKVTRLNRRWAEITVPKAARVRFKLSRPLPAARLGMARVTVDGKSRWHVSFPGSQPAVAREPTGRLVGVDLGVATTVATSDGRMFRVPVMRARQKRRLVALERRKARQRKGSRRWQTTKASIAALHQDVADRRRNWIETNTTLLVRDYDLTVVENLQVKNMVRRPAPRPDPEQPGAFLPSGARAKAGLNRSIHAQGWGMWRRRLKEKADASGIAVRLIAAAHTSDACRACGHTCPDNRESQAVFRCRDCGHEGHADIEAARNILARALRSASTPGPGAAENHSAPASAHHTELVAAGTTRHPA